MTFSWPSIFPHLVGCSYLWYIYILFFFFVKAKLLCLSKITHFQDGKLMFLSHYFYSPLLHPGLPTTFPLSLPFYLLFFSVTCWKRCPSQPPPAAARFFCSHETQQPGSVWGAVQMQGGGPVAHLSLHQRWPLTVPSPRVLSAKLGSSLKTNENIKTQRHFFIIIIIILSAVPNPFSPKSLIFILFFGVQILVRGPLLVEADVGLAASQLQGTWGKISAMWGFT